MKLKGCIDEEKLFVAHFRESDHTIQTIEEHLRETAELSGRNADKISLRDVGRLLGYLHDLGKATDEFNNYIMSATGLLEASDERYVDAECKKGKIDHATAGAQEVFEYFIEKSSTGIFSAQILATVIASHHSGLIDCLQPDGINYFSDRINKSEEKTRRKEAINNMDSTILKELKNLFEQGIDNVIVNKISFIRQKNPSKDISVFMLGLLTRFLLSCLIDADRLNTADFDFPKGRLLRNDGHYKTWSHLIERLERKMGSFQCRNHVDTIRKEISDQCLNFAIKEKGIFQLTVPTGGGKTLASLRFALNHAQKYEMDRILYVIPFTSIIDQNAQCIREILEERNDNGLYGNKIVLEHHSNLTPEEENDTQKLLSENWDAPIVLTTMVQLLETVFGYGTRGARRMHQLANTVIIFDEIQTLNVKMVYLFNTAIKFLVDICGATVVLCTATQPLLDKVEPYEQALKIGEDQKIIADEEKLYRDLKRVNLYNKCRVGGWNDEEIASLAEIELTRSGSVLIIVNTKKSAIRLFDQLKGNDSFELYHLSTNMCPSHRMEVLKVVKDAIGEAPEKPNRPIICISTQLIEAGVDVDFGTVIRYLAGLDSITQAAGRCNRNGRRLEGGDAYIVNPKEENLDKLQDIKSGCETTLRILHEFEKNPKDFDDDLLSSKTMKKYFQYYFYNHKDQMGYPIKKTSIINREDSLYSLLSSNKLSVAAHQRMNNEQEPRLVLRQSFKSAAQIFQSIDSITRGVIVPYGEGKEIINDLCSMSKTAFGQQYQLIKRAQRYSVNVWGYMLQKLSDSEVIHETQKDSGIFYLDEQFYDENFGLSDMKRSEMDLLLW